ncbi:MAG: hypothetical protein HC923_02735, partial [Myxococcales bacterium]|nr:hypothetical protein [Myxococcales bacterium]
MNAFSRVALLRCIHDPSRRTPSVVEAYLAPYASYRDRVAVDAFVKDIPMEPDHPTRAVLRGIEDRLVLLEDKPMLLVWGGARFLLRSALPRRVAAAIPGA